MYFEAKGKTKEAEDLIAKMLSEHPDSHFALKRQVTLLKDQNLAICSPVLSAAAGSAAVTEHVPVAACICSLVLMQYQYGINSAYDSCTVILIFIPTYLGPPPCDKTAVSL